MDECEKSIYCENNTWTIPRRNYTIGDPMDMLRPWKNNNDFVLIIATHSITFLIGIIGNVIVIKMMTREKTSRSATSMFLVSLAVADLLLLSICTPLVTLNYFMPSMDQGPLCILSSYVLTLSTMASALNLTAVGFERYVVIVYPMHSRVLCTMSNCRKALIVVWFAACVLSLPVTVIKTSEPLMYYNNSTSVIIYYCFDKEGTLAIIMAIYLFIVVFGLPLLFMSFCYFRVIVELWMSTVTMSAMTRINSTNQFDSRSSISSSLRNTTLATSTSSSTNSFLHRNSPTRQSSNSDEVRHARKQVIKMLIIIVLLFLVCWGPHLFWNILIKIGLNSYSGDMYSLNLTFKLLPFIHSCMNPIIYSLMSSNFRRIMMRLCSNQSCGNEPSFCCQKSSTTTRLRYRSTTATLARPMPGLVPLPNAKA